MKLNDVPVTIVGGGPAGLALGLALARQGVASRVLEIKSTTTDHPKARGVWQRAMEILRQFGVEDRVRDGGLPDSSDIFAMVDGLENEMGRTSPEPMNDHARAWKCIVAQDAVEEALVWRMSDYTNAQICWSTEFLDARDVADGVKIRAKDLSTGETLTWKSQYVVGADGGAGVAAKAAGIEYERTPTLSVMLNTYFRADLSAYDCARTAAVLNLRLEKPEQRPIGILNTNGSDRWLMLNPIGVEKDERERPNTTAETQDFIREILRKPNLDVKVINETTWRVTRRIANQFRKNRFFLVGDAAHRFPPTGGFGMNSGIEDIHNLAWKLAFVLSGQAPDGLLDTYEEERRPIAFDNAKLAMANYKRMPFVKLAISSGDRDRIAFWLRDLDYHIHSIGHTLGFVYDVGALVPDGSTRPSHIPREYRPSDRPGSRYPHIWLDAAHTHSTIDLFDKTLVLMVGADGDAWVKAAAAVAGVISIPLPVHQFGVVDPRHGLQMGDRGAALVRPDGVTAWRTGWASSDPKAELQHVVETVLRLH